MHITGSRDLNLMNKVVRISPYGKLICTFNQHCLIYKISNKLQFNSSLFFSPMRAWGVKSRMCPPYPQRDRKRRLNGAVCRNHRIKGWSRVGARTGTLKNPTKCLWRWEPDRRSNFFFSPPAHLCAVTYMTEISLIVTLNNQFNNFFVFLKTLRNCVALT